MFVYNRLEVYTTRGTTAFSASHNQAALASQKGFAGGINGERRFLLQQLPFYQMAASLPTTSGNFGVNADLAGDASFRHLRFGLAYGRSLGEWVSIGAQFNYRNIQSAGYGSAGAVDFETGIIVHLTENLHTGFHVANPTRSQYNKGTEERLPTVFTSGLGYQPNEQFLLAAELEKVEGNPIAVHIGALCRVDKALVARLGFSAPIGTYYLGAGVAFGSFRIDLTASLHPQLGLTPGIQIIFAEREE